MSEELAEKLTTAVVVLAVGILIGCLITLGYFYPKGLSVPISKVDIYINGELEREGSIYRNNWFAPEGAPEYTRFVVLMRSVDDGDQIDIDDRGRKITDFKLFHPNNYYTIITWKIPRIPR